MPAVSDWKLIFVAVEVSEEHVPWGAGAVFLMYHVAPRAAKVSRAPVSVILPAVSVDASVVKVSLAISPPVEQVVSEYAL